MAKPKEPKDEASPPAPAIPGRFKDEYSTVDECTSILSQAVLNPRHWATPESLTVGPAAPGQQEDSLNMVECDLYSQPADAVGGANRNIMPDISPYACFYGAPKHQVLKRGWLDKLSPQG